MAKEEEELWEDDVFNFEHLSLKVNGRFQRWWYYFKLKLIVEFLLHRQMGQKENISTWNSLFFVASYKVYSYEKLKNYKVNFLKVIKQLNYTFRIS